MRRPSRQEELMLLAALGPEDVARAAWFEVVRGLDIGTLRFESHAVLPLLAKGLRRLGYQYVDLPRLDGVRRRTWYVNRRRVSGVANVVDRLSSRMDAPLLTGGLGVLLVGGDLGLRWLTTADIVIAADAYPSAVAVLRQVSWRRLGHRRDGALLDLHAEQWGNGQDEPVTLRWGDGRWPYDGVSCALPVELQEESTALVATPADLLAFTLVDAPRMLGYTPVRLHADALQLVPLVDEQGWRRLTDVAGARGAVPQVREALRYLAGTLYAPVPCQLLTDDAWPRKCAIDRLASHTTARSDTLAAYLRRRASPEPTSLPGFLQQVWEVPHAAQVPGAALRRVWARLH